MMTQTRWELAAEGVAIKIRWFGLVIGLIYVNLGTVADPLPLNAILGLGAVFTVLDTIDRRRGRIFLENYPLSISFLEALFIGLLCYFDVGLDSPFRFYYLLSLICCAIRYSPRLTIVTCALDCLSFTALYLAAEPFERRPFALMLMLLVLVWVTWAASALARLLKKAGEDLSHLNSALRENQALLEERIEERSRQLQDSQAQVIHQEKMAAFGLLAAGIAHEVGNPLTSISSLVQMLQKRDIDEYTAERLELVSGQLTRIQGTLRELINFSRPAAREPIRCIIADIVEEALRIAKYYKGSKGRKITAEVPTDLPIFVGRRDQLVQVVLNLVLNAIDATGKSGNITIRAGRTDFGLRIEVSDDGLGIPQEQQGKLFQPYFTTKEHGTGLGLFVTSKLIAANGGTIGFTSAPGYGTTFAVNLPIPRE